MNLDSSPLVFDIGMHNGDDTAFYLSCGFRVVAVEADPTLAALAGKRFKKDILLGNLVIKNIGIADQNGEATFWINAKRTHFNSFDKKIAGRFGDEITPIKITCQTFSSLIEQHGVPHYAKIDIEGNDIICIRQLQKKSAPEYISVEMTLSENLPLELSKIGYQKFKIVSQHGFIVPNSTSLAASEKIFRSLTRVANENIENRTIAKRVKRKVAAIVISLGSECHLWNNHKVFKSKINPEWEFREGSSGSYGEDLAGFWMNQDDILKIWSRDHEYHQSIGRECWCDLHAKR